MPLLNALGDLLGIFKTVTVEQVRPIGPRFRELTLTGTPLIGATFTPGDKVQLLLQGGARTYSPFAFDSERGSLRLLIYLHGDGPGTTFAHNVRDGDQVRLFGPRSSLDFKGLTSAVFFGDETSFGVARALSDTTPDASFVFEVTSTDDASRALEHLGLPNTNLFAKASYPALITSMALQAETTVILTGQSRSIQAMRALLREQRIKGQKNKAYWAPGKRGLD